MMLVSTVLVAVLYTNTALASCYWPNGTDRNLAWDSSGQTAPYQPCQVGNTKMCCRTGDGTDHCDPTGSGLCIGPQNYWRESCTDPTWKDPGCLRLFISGKSQSGGDELDRNDADLLQCDDGTWCEGRTNTKCCKDGQGLRILNGQVVKGSTTSTTASHITSAPSQTTSPSSNSDQSSRPSDSSSGPSAQKSTNTGAIVGGVLGGVAVIGAAVGAGLFIIARRRRTSREQQGVNLTSSGAPAMIFREHSKPERWGYESPMVSATPAPAQPSPVYEMPATSPLHPHKPSG